MSAAPSPRRNSTGEFGVLRQRILRSPVAHAFALSAKAKARQLLLGDKNRSFHGLLASELAKPIRVKLKDKVAFTLGILNICLSELLLLVRTSCFLAEIQARLVLTRCAPAVCRDTQSGSLYGMSAGCFHSWPGASCRILVRSGSTFSLITATPLTSLYCCICSCFPRPRWSLR
jgi:hypothetical protein